MGRFDPKEGKPYGIAEDTGEEFATKEDAADWMSRNRGKSIQVTNPAREERIRNAVESLVEDALDSAFEDLDRLVQRGGITEEEADKAIPWVDIEGSWLDWKNND